MTKNSLIWEKNSLILLAANLPSFEELLHVFDVRSKCNASWTLENVLYFLQCTSLLRWGGFLRFFGPWACFTTLFLGLLSFEHEMMEMVWSYGQNSEFVTGLENSVPEIGSRDMSTSIRKQNNVRNYKSDWVNSVKSLLAGLFTPC